MFAPKYYNRFRCIAERCTHSCCVGWEIDVDEATLSLYRTLEGEIGEQIRESITVSEDGSSCFALRPDGRCPHLDDCGLCRIISALGDGALCDICAEHPRFYNEVAGRTECGVGASCEEAARLILAERDYASIECVGGENEENSHTCADFDVLGERSALYTLLSGEGALQERLGRIAERFGASRLGVERRTALLAELEYLDGAHKALLMSCAPSDTLTPDDEVLCERFFAYLVYRHASPECTAEGFGAAVGVALLVSELFASLIASGEDAVQSARVLSEEIEYCEENVARIRDALIQ